MATLIKNQIVKHLSKYAKNLNPDNINVDVLKGKGALHNVELNEVLLTEILELPAWLSIEFAICNTVSLKVPWTSLKTLPIVLFIDEVKIEVVMSSKLRTSKSPNTALNISAYSNMDYTGYGFVNKVLEGMTLNINSLEVKFSSEHFGGSLILNQLQIASCTPHWKPSPTDLHQTRLKDVSTNEILIFKMLTWQLLRVEASASIDPSSTDNKISAPLRFITSQGRAQITVKKSSLNGAVSAGRIQLILNDLLWVATLSQVQSAISFYHYILTLIQQGTNLHKNEPDMSVLKTPVHINDETKSLPAYASLTQPKMYAKSPLFEKFDIVQSSYHFYADCIDLHICDETNSEILYPNSWDFRSGALQVTLTRLVCDFYPYHLVAGDRKHWVYYNESEGAVWMKKLLSHYFEKFTSEERFHTESIETANIWSKMRSLCCLVRLYDLKVYCVSESPSTDTHNGAKVQLFLGADKDILQLPGEPPPLITLEFNCYYFQSVHGSFPVPPYSTHIEINPIILFADLRSVRWMSFIYLNLCKTLNLDAGSVEFIPHSDVRIEAIMPKMIVSNQSSSSKILLTDQDRLILSTSSCTLTNIEIDIADRSRSKNLIDYLKTLRDFELFTKLFDIKSDPTLKFHQIPQKSDALRLFTGSDYNTNFFVDGSMSNSQMLDVLRKSALNDVWITEMNPVWIDFAGSTVSTSNKNSPFLCDTSLNVWSFMGNKLNENVENSDFYLFAKPTTPLKIVLNKNQYGFLMRLIDQVNAFTTLLNEDSKCFYQAMQPKSLIMACLCQHLEINLIMHASNGEIPYTRERNRENQTEIDENQCESSTAEQKIELSPSNSKKNEIPLKDQNVPRFSVSSSDSSLLSNSVSNTVLSTTARIEYAVPIFGEMPKDLRAQLSEKSTPILEINPIGSNQMFQQPEDAISVQTDFSEDEILNGCGTLYADLTDEQDFMFVDIFASLVREKNLVVKQRLTADVAEEAIEISYENNENNSNNNNNVNTLAEEEKLQGHVLTCSLTQTQVLLTCYDCESCLTFRSPNLRLLKQDNSLRNLKQFYAEISTKMRENSLNFAGDVNNVVLQVQSTNDGRNTKGLIEVQIKDTLLTLNADYLEYLSDFIRIETDLNSASGEMRIAVGDVDLELIDDKMGPTFVRISRASIHQGVDRDTFMQIKPSIDKPSNESEEKDHLNELRMKNQELRQRLKEAYELLTAKNISISYSDLDL